MHQEKVSLLNSFIRFVILAVAAAVGTYVGGALADGGKGGVDYESCYKGGAYASLAALAVIPWITARDPEVEEFKAAQRAEAAARGGGLRRRHDACGRCSGLDDRRRES